MGSADDDDYKGQQLCFGNSTGMGNWCNERFQQFINSQFKIIPSYGTWIKLCLDS